MNHALLQTIGNALRLAEPLMHSTQLRREHIHGMMLGVAIGDSLGQARNGLTSRQALKLFGRQTLRFRFARDVGIYGFNTSQVWMTAQSIVSSGTEIGQFGESLRKRLALFSLSFPTDMKSASRRFGLKACLSFRKTPQASNSLGNDNATRSILIVLALNNTNLGTRNWIEHSARLTHLHPLVIEGSHLLAGLTNLSITERGAINTPAAAKFLSEMDCSSEYANRLKQMVGYLENDKSAAYVARQFGWGSGTPGEIVPTVVMAIYCFLRHPTDFQKAVSSAIRLGGDVSALGALVGGLSGARLGVRRLPQQLVQQIPDDGYGPAWIDDMAHRLAQWPHGADDLHDAPTLPASPISVLRRNLGKRIRRASHWLTRRPCTLCAGTPLRSKKR